MHVEGVLLECVKKESLELRQSWLFYPKILVFLYIYIDKKIPKYNINILNFCLKNLTKLKTFLVIMPV